MLARRGERTAHITRVPLVNIRNYFGDLWRQESLRNRALILIASVLRLISRLSHIGTCMPAVLLLVSVVATHFLPQGISHYSSGGVFLFSIRANFFEFTACFGSRAELSFWQDALMVIQLRTSVVAHRSHGRARRFFLHDIWGWLLCRLSSRLISLEKLHFTNDTDLFEHVRW